MTGTTLIYGALRLCRGGLGRAGRLASPEQLTDGLARLNDMIDAWALEPLTIFHVLRTVQNLASGTPSYTIGTGGTINIVRPDKIEAARLIIDTSAAVLTEMPLQVFTEQDWQNVRQKAYSSPYAAGIYYDRGWSAGLGLIYPWPVPNISTTQMVLYTLQALTAFPDNTTVITLPPAYAKALRLNLALELAPEFGGLSDPITLKQATDAKMVLKRANANARPKVAQLDSRVPGVGAGNIYDWRTDETR